MKQSEVLFGIKFGCFTGLISAIVYPLMISTHGYNWWNFVLEISFGPLFIISNIGLYLFIKHHGNSFFNLIAIIFNVLAGAGILITNTVQKAIFTIGKDYHAAHTETSKEIIQKTYQIGNLVQLGLDFYFDVLVSFATMFLAFAIYKQHYYPKWLTPLGIIIGVGGLAINTIEFPVPPANLGFFDPGPFYAAFSFFLLAGIVYRMFIKNPIQK